MKIIKKNLPKILLFTAIFLILAGGLCTYLTAESVHVHLREGESSNATNSFFKEDLSDTNSNAASVIPFTIRLEKFDIEYHEGTRAPKDYISLITLIDKGQEEAVRISMNKIARHRGHRIFQEDYDEDLKGSVLLVRYDPWGTTIVYTGFVLLLISMLCLLIRRDGAFRRLLRALSVTSLLLLSIPASALPKQVSENSIQDTTLNPKPSAANCQLSAEEAEAFGRLSVYYRGRIAPFDSYARDYCKAAFPKGTAPADYHPVQLVTDIYLFPERWPNKPQPAMRLFPQESHWLTPDEDLALAQNSDTLFIAHILDWLRQSIQEENHPQNIQIINSIASFQKQRSTPGSIRQQQQEIEILYNQVRPEKKIFMMEILLALVLFILFIAASSSPWTKRCAYLFIIIGLTFTLADIGLRCYLSGHNPFSGTFDTLMLLAAGMLLIGLFVCRTNNFIALPTLIAAAFITLAATLMGGSSFSPLMPVLISPWLILHVAIIMTSYCFLVFTFLLAIISFIMFIIKKEAYKKLKIKYLSQIFCILGVVFLAIGIMVGSAWANVSWGQYWSWDPKETWALITLLGYSVALPGVIPATEKKDWLYHLLIVAAFLLLLTTYFGVNFWMGGMHSY